MPNLSERLPTPSALARAASMRTRSCDVCRPLRSPPRSLAKFRGERRARARRADALPPPADDDQARPGDRSGRSGQAAPTFQAADLRAVSARSRRGVYRDPSAGRAVPRSAGLLLRSGPLAAVRAYARARNRSRTYAVACVFDEVTGTMQSPNPDVSCFRELVVVE